MATAKNLIITPTWTSTNQSKTGWEINGGGTPSTASRGDAPFGARLAYQQNDTSVPGVYAKVEGHKWVPGKRYYVNLAYWINKSGDAGNVTVYLRPPRAYKGPWPDEAALDSDAEKLVFADQKVFTTINYYQVHGYVSVPTDLPSDYWTDMHNNPATVDGDTDLWIGITNENSRQWISIAYLSVVEAEHAEAGLDWYFDGAGNISDIPAVYGYSKKEPDPALGATYAWDGTPYSSTTTATYIGAEPEPDPAVETTTTLSVVPSEIIEGESVSLTATVTPVEATGSVDFTVDGITSSAQVIDGVAVSEVSIFEWGDYEVLAEFVPDDEADFLPSSDTSSVTVTEYIPPPEPVETTTTLTVVPNTIYEGGSAVLTATVSPSQAQGSVTFTLDGATDTIPVSGGTAAREVTVMNAGDYEVNATFAPVSEDFNPSSATPQILSVRPYVEPVDPEGPWDEWSALAANLGPKVAAYAGRPDHAETIEIAQAQLPVVAEYVRGHTRGRGFENAVPASPLLAVIVSACARLVTNPEQIQYYSVGDYSERPAMLAGWTLTELDVLRRYRRTQA